MTARARRLHEGLDRSASVVAAMARGLAWASFGSAIVIGIAIVAEMDERPAQGMFAVVVLVFVLSLPGWMLLVFRGALTSAREIPAAVLRAWPTTARAAHGRRGAEGALATGAVAGRGVWVGRRELGLVKAGLVVTRWSFVLGALACAVVALIEIVLAIGAVVATLLV